jgi:hypothetical protein
MKNIFSLFILMLFAEQFCFATIENSFDTIAIVKKECKASLVDGNNYNTFSLTYFEFDSLPIPLRDSVEKRFANFLNKRSRQGDTVFDLKQIAIDFISPLNESETGFEGQFSVVAQTKNYFTVEYSFFVNVFALHMVVMVQLNI